VIEPGPVGSYRKLVKEGAQLGRNSGQAAVLSVGTKQRNKWKQLMPETQEILLIECKPLKKDRVYIGFLVVFWLIWAPGTVYATWLINAEFSWFLLAWLVFGYAGTILIPLSLLGINGKDIITITPDGVRVLYDHGIIKHRVFILKDNIESVTLEKVDQGTSFGESGIESVWTLNIFQKSGWRWKRVMIATSAHPEEKERIYCDLVRIFSMFDYSFQQKNDYTYAPGKALTSR
jgi:hypothetical protein